MDKRPYPEKGKERIQATLILDRLNQHVLGEVDMSATQINAARILLAKVIPDIKQVEQTVSGEIEQRHKIDKQSVSDAIKVLREELDSVRA